MSACSRWNPPSKGANPSSIFPMRLDGTWRRDEIAIIGTRDPPFSMCASIRQGFGRLMSSAYHGTSSRIEKFPYHTTSRYWTAAQRAISIGRLTSRDTARLFEATAPRPGVISSSSHASRVVPSAMPSQGVLEILWRVKYSRKIA